VSARSEQTGVAGLADGCYPASRAKVWVRRGVHIGFARRRLVDFKAEEGFSPRDDVNAGSRVAEQ